MYEPYRNPLPRKAAVLEWRLRKCRNLKIYQWDSARRLRRGLRRADFKKLSNQLTPPLLIECRRRELRLRREIRSFSHVLWIWSRCSYGKSRNHGMSSEMVDRWDPSNGGIASKVRGGLFNSAEHLVKFIAGMYRDACIPNEHYWFFAKNSSVG
jgi:hypothetical protein